MSGFDPPILHDAAGLRRFALKLFPFALGSGLLLFKGRWTCYAIWVGAWTGIILLGLAVPILIKPLRIVATWLGHRLGKVAGFCTLAAVYFLAMAPLAWMARKLGKEFLAVKRDPKLPSYWIERKPADKDAWERQY